MKILIILAALVLTGCGTPILYATNPRQVMIGINWSNVKEVQALADTECAKYKRYARLWHRNYDGGLWTYACVE